MPLTVQGAAEVRATLQRMGDGVQRETLEEAALYAAQPIVETAQQLAPILQVPRVGRTPGQLRTSIMATLKPRRRTDLAKVEIGPVKSKGNDPWWAKFVEFGHRIVRRGVTGGTTIRLKVKGGGRGTVLGFVRARPFLRPALVQRSAEAAERFRQRIMDAVAKAAR